MRLIRTSYLPSEWKKLGELTIASSRQTKENSEESEPHTWQN